MTTRTLLCPVLALTACLRHAAQLSGYYLFWATILPYYYSLWSAAGATHALFATYLWVNTTWNIALAAVVDPGTLQPVADPAGCAVENKSRWPAGI